MKVIPATVTVGGPDHLTVLPDDSEIPISARNVTGHWLLGGERVTLMFVEPSGVYVFGIIGHHPHRISRGLMDAVAGGTNGKAYDFGSSGVGVPTTTGSVTGIGSITVDLVPDRWIELRFLGAVRDDTGAGAGEVLFVKFIKDSVDLGTVAEPQGADQQDYGSSQFSWPIATDAVETAVFEVEWFTVAPATTTIAPCFWIVDEGSASRPQAV